MVTTLKRHQKKLITLGVSAGIASQATAAIILACSGYVDQQNTPGLEKRGQSTVTVVINEADNVMKISGWWGCLADMGQESKERTGDNGKCLGFLSYSQTATEFIFFEQSDGPNYAGFGGVTIDRVTGKFSASFMATSKPAANANWSIITTTALMTCKVGSKLF